jgi:hypothetical protein
MSLNFKLPLSSHGSLRECLRHQCLESLSHESNLDCLSLVITFESLEIGAGLIV